MRYIHNHAQGQTLSLACYKHGVDFLYHFFSFLSSFSFFLFFFFSFFYFAVLMPFSFVLFSFSFFFSFLFLFLFSFFYLLLCKMVACKISKKFFPFCSLASIISGSICTHVHSHTYTYMHTLTHTYMYAHSHFFPSMKCHISYHCSWNLKSCLCKPPVSVSTFIV